MRVIRKPGAITRCATQSGRVREHHPRDVRTLAAGIIVRDLLPDLREIRQSSRKWVVDPKARMPDRTGPKSRSETGMKNKLVKK